MNRSKMMQQTVFVVAVIGSLLLLNVLGVRLFGRIDVTRDGAYTLSKATKETVGSLDESVTVTAYFTENLPAPYSSNARYVRDLLEEFRSASKGKVSFEFIDPASQETDQDKETKKEMKQDIFGRRFREPTAIEKELATTGIQPVEIRVIEEDQQQTKRAYMGLVIRYGEKKEVIPVVQGVTGLEYDVTSLIRKMTRPKTPVIALLQGHDEPKPQEKLQHFSTLISQTYDVRPVELGPKDRFEAEVDAVFVMGPKKPLAPNELKAIDQFLMEGKPVAFMVDSVSVDLRTFESTPAQSGLGALLNSYGVTLGDKLIADVSSANVNVQERRGYMVVSSPSPYPFIPVVKRLEGESPVSKGLGEITFPFVTEVKATSSEGREVVVLARSSDKSWLENSPANVDPRRDWRSETITPTGPYPLMIQVAGKLTSHFAAEATTSSAPGASALLAQTQKDARFIVIGTGSLFTDDFLTSRPNAALLMNVADWLLLDPALLAMRSRGMAVAPLKADLSDGARSAVKFGNTLGLPLLLAAFGLIRWRMREARRLSESVS